LMQVELDALDPALMRQLYANAISEFWDEFAYAAVVEYERQQRESAS
jgi:hypothetical protein